MTIMSKRLNISLLISTMVAAVLFGIGAVAVLSVPTLNSYAAMLLPIVIVASLLAAPFISWTLAPRLTSAWQRKYE